MTPSEAIVEKIQRSLQSGVPNAAVAADFSKECSKVNARLEQIREILDSGQELQALLMAENPPPVLDEAARLQAVFDEWSVVCEQHGFDIPPPLISNAAQRLNLLYAKGISSDHKIYKDFREAVMGRDDVRALEIARAIEKLNPADSNAKSERSRLLAKVFRDREQALRESLESSDIPSVLRLLHSLESLGAAELENSSQIFARAGQARQAWAAAKALEEVRDNFLPKLETLVNAPDWRKAREVLARIDSQVAEHRLVLDPPQLGTMGEAREFVQREFAAVQRHAEFQESLRHLLTHVDHIDTLAHGSGVRGLKETRELFAELKRLWQKVEGFSMEVRADIVQRVSKQVEFLDHHIQSLQRRNFMLIGGSAVVAALVVAAGGWWLLGVHNARMAAMEIRHAISKKLVGAVQSLPADVRQKNLTRFSADLVASIAEADAFLKAEAARFESVSRELSNLEAGADKEFAGVGLQELQEKWTRFEAEVAVLAEESRDPLVPRVNKAGRAVKEALSKLSEDSFAELAKRLKSYQEKNVPPLEKSSDVLELQKNVELAQSELDSWAPLLAANSSSNPIPPDILTRAERFRQQLRSLSADVEKAVASRQAMREARNLEDFLKARDEFTKSLSSASSTDVQNARLSMATRATQEAILGEMLMPWDPTAWPVFLKGGEGQALKPEELAPSEIPPYKKLLDDRYCGNIYQSRITGPNERTIFTQDRALLDTSIPGDLSYRGRVFDPSFAGASSGDITFIEVLYKKNGIGQREQISSPIKNEGLAGFAVMFSKIDAKNFIDSDDRPQFPAWQLVDRATSTKKTDPVYFAYVVQSVQDMVKFRPREWGAHFAPSFAKLAARVEELMAGDRVHAGAWINSPEIRQKLAQLDLSPTNIKAEAVLNKSLAETCKSKPLQYAGFVDPDGKPVVLASVDSLELWGLSGTPKDHKAALIATRGGDSNDWQMNGKPIPFTPLFFYAGDRRAALSAAAKKAGINDLAKAGVVIPPLFAESAHATPLP
jgi:hypothetical protein